MPTEEINSSIISLSKKEGISVRKLVKGYVWEVKILSISDNLEIKDFERLKKFESMVKEQYGNEE
jgi:hypothetical protein